MDIYLLDKNFEIVSIVDDFTSLIWRRKYYECGDFELHCSHELFETIASEAKYVYRPDRNEVGLIENYGLTYPTSFCKGRFLESLLGDKIIYPTAKYNGLPHEVIVLALVTTFADGIEIGRIAGIGSSITTQVTGDNLMDYIYALLKTIDASIRIRCNLQEKKKYIEVWKGKDRRDSAVFSQEWDNLVSFNYEFSSKDYRNYAVVAGQNEGADRVSVTVDKTNGETRRELFVDARDLQQDDDESLEHYKARLEQRGKEKLSEYQTIEKCDTEIDTQANLKYMVDFDLGDICTIADNSHKIVCEKRITECEEIYENGALSLMLTFGEGYKILKDYIIRELK